MDQSSTPPSAESEKLVETVGADTDLKVICLPVVIFTQKDADEAVAKCPIKKIDNCENYVAVVAFAKPEDLKDGVAQMQITHWAKKISTGKAKIRGQWNVRIMCGPVVMDAGDESKHIGRVYFRVPDPVKPKGPHLIVPGEEVPEKGIILGADGQKA